MGNRIEGPRNVAGELITSVHLGSSRIPTDRELEKRLRRWNKASKVLDDPGPSIRVGKPKRNR